MDPKKFAEKVENQRWLEPLCVALLLAAIAARVTESALKLGAFGDEIGIQQATYRFFTELNFTAPLFSNNFPFGPEFSVKPGTSWPDIFAWLWNGSLFQSRMIYSFLTLLQAALVGRLAYSRIGIRAASTAALVTLLLFLHLPYWFGFIQSLGELDAMVWLALGCVLLPRRPLAAAFCWGFCVWQGKFIYAPAVAALSLAWALSEGFRNAKKVLHFALVVQVPLLIWLALIALRFDVATLVEWIHRSLHFSAGNGSGIENLGHQLTFSERMHSPHVEWAGYGIATKAKILVLLFAPFPVSLAFYRRSSSKLERLSLLALSCSILAYAAWWFGFSSYMAARHIQPALYLASCLLAYCLARRFRPNAPLKLAALLFAIGELYAASRADGWKVEGARYSETCRGTPFNPACGP